MVTVDSEDDGWTQKGGMEGGWHEYLTDLRPCVFAHSFLLQF